MPTLRAKVARYSVTIMYGIMACIVLFGFLHVDRITDLRCQDAKINREALRDDARFTAALGRRLTADTPDPRRMTAVLAEFDRFEQERLRALPPLECP